MEEILHLFIHTIEGTWLIFPLLWLTYCIIEYWQRNQTQDEKIFLALQKYGPLIGSLVGLIPQCGFLCTGSYFIYATKHYAWDTDRCYDCD